MGQFFGANSPAEVRQIVKQTPELLEDTFFETLMHLAGNADGKKLEIGTDDDVRLANLSASSQRDGQAASAMAFRWKASKAHYVRRV